ncbi:hypothetical protein FRB94_012021 [Tulasnella sp. JGI-2019a]|nr:hypothetical protein FRB93_010429 [Tulasnella sp. JGI-2019a]KAG8992079.1 hypothetical protein FRB94_012021 [Tulasnella sp. JGI-2019a]KAG9024175.1 hypothetical protein FRB95_011971 [Tulasnella sp. JGI-2019a]
MEDITEGPGIFGPDSHTAKAQKWLKGLCHWHRVFVDLRSNGAIARLLAPRQLQIKVVESMPIADPTHQASLSETLIVLDPQNPDFEKIARNLLRHQTRHVIDDGGPGIVLAGGRRGDEEWTRIFRGHVHCEAYLACDTQASLLMCLTPTSLGFELIYYSTAIDQGNRHLEAMLFLLCGVSRGTQPSPQICRVAG